MCIRDREESAVEKLRTAPERLEVFIQQIRKKEKGIFNDYEGDTPEESTRELAKLIEPYSVTAPFYIEKDKCIGCGLCEKICTAKAIQMQEGKPVWVKDHCNICLACINPVSYTHLDVYKRQAVMRSCRPESVLFSMNFFSLFWLCGR